jgi:hypothetical protein
MDLLDFWGASHSYIGDFAEALEQANVDETTSELEFKQCSFDDDITVRAVIDLFHRAFQKGRQFKELRFLYSSGRVDEILHVVSSFDMFEEMFFEGDDSGLSQQGFWSMSAAMKFNKTLTKLHLEDIDMTRQQAAALGAGLITSNSEHFKELCMERVRFADGAITEIASGLKKNASLCMLNVYGCNLDAELAEVVDAVESHPSLKALVLGGNQGQEQALVALGKVLTSSRCRLEGLGFCRQNRDPGGLSGRLGMLAQALEGYSSLTNLNLSSNSLVDEDIDHLRRILATCRLLEKVDLSDNIITLSGFVCLTQSVPKSLKSFLFTRNYFAMEDAACHTIALFEEHPQMCEIGFGSRNFNWPMDQKFQHIRDLNRCGRILLLAREAAIPLSVWPIVLARANTLLEGSRNSEERTSNAIFHLLQGPALMQRRFDGDTSQAMGVGAGASERFATSSIRPAEDTIDKESAKKGKSE